MRVVYPEEVGPYTQLQLAYQRAGSTLLRNQYLLNVEGLQDALVYVVVGTCIDVLHPQFLQQRNDADGGSQIAAYRHDDYVYFLQRQHAQGQLVAGINLKYCVAEVLHSLYTAGVAVGGNDLMP